MSYKTKFNRKTKSFQRNVILNLIATTTNNTLNKIHKLDMSFHSIEIEKNVISK